MNFKKQLTYKKEIYTKSEKVIANYFLKGNKSVTSKQLAEDLHVSPATISRFVKKLDMLTTMSLLTSIIMNRSLQAVLRM